MEITKKQETVSDIFLGISGAIIGWLFVSLMLQPAGNSLTLLFFLFATFCSLSFIWIGRLIL